MKYLIPFLALAACGPSVSGRPDADLVNPDAEVVVDSGPIADARPVPENAAVYAHSSTELFRIDPETLVPTSVGLFTFAGTSQHITDIAVDRTGYMVGISLNSVYAIDRETAEATLLAALQGDHGLTSLSFVPIDLEDPSQGEQLVAADFDGVVWEIDPETGATTTIGNYNVTGADIGSSGDIVSIANFGTLATVNIAGEDNDHLARLAPNTWQATIIGDTGKDKIFGLGFWGGEIYGFTDNSEFLTIDADSGAVTDTVTGSVAWWGAGVTTIAPIVTSLP